MPRVYPEGHLIEVFTINVPGRNLVGSLFQTQRATGRRIRVHETGKEVWDSDDCYDLGNASAKLDDWLLTLIPSCDVCQAPAFDGQTTAETVLCGACAKKAAAEAAALVKACMTDLGGEAG